MRYDVVGVLGRGGAATVELAVDRLGRRVATKRVTFTGSATQMAIARQRLRREAEILSKLAHPGIVPILDVIDSDWDVVLVFPAMLENLEDRVNRVGPLPPREVAGIGWVLLSALAVAHRHGVVHRDIKPSNVLFDDGGRPALSDFGVAITSELTCGLTPSGSVIGTPRWMAPEQARGERAGPASDVFSLATTLGFALTGCGPYGSAPPEVLLGRAARGDVPPLPSWIPDDLRVPLGRMLDPEPDRRPSAAGILGGVDGTLQSHAPAPPAPAPPAAASSPARRHRLATSAFALTTAIAVFVGVSLIDPATVDGRSRLAPHTNGFTCDPGWFNLDGLAANGCEAHSDYVAGTSLTAQAPIHADVVPPSSIDSFSTHVSGDSLDFCWGSLDVTLTAPAHTTEKVIVWNGATPAASAVSTNGTPATATVYKPSCFGGDSEDLQVTVGVVAATGGASAADFTLTRDAGW